MGKRKIRYIFGGEMAESSFMNKALEAMKKGDKAIKGSFFGNIVNDKKQRAEAAQEHYRNAATNFKLAKSWDLAAQALQRVVDCDQIMGGGDSADILVEAGNMIKKVNSADAISYYEKAAEQYFSENRIKNAAKLKKQIGETYEQDLEHTLAIKFYQEAADLYYAEGETTSDYTNLKLKVADLQVSQIDPDYVKAIKIYEEVADKYLENKLTEPSAKNLYFKSILLYIINDDTVGANISINKYIDKSPSFGGTRQQKFLTNLIKAVDENNIEQFSKICYEHNEIIPFDKWQLGILAKIRERVEKLAGSKQLHLEEEDEKPEKKIEDLF